MLTFLIYSLLTFSADSAFLPPETSFICSWKTVAEFPLLIGHKRLLAANNNNCFTTKNVAPTSDPNPPIFTSFKSGVECSSDVKKTKENTDGTFKAGFSCFENQHQIGNIAKAAASTTAQKSYLDYKKVTIENESNNLYSTSSLQETLSQENGLANFVATAKQKVFQIREDLDKKELEYEAMVTGLRSDIKNQAERYDNQYKGIQFQFENYKAIDAQEKIALREEMKSRSENLETMAKEQEAILTDEINVLKQMLDLANCEVELANNLTGAVSDQHGELASQTEDLKEKYIEDSMDWEDRLEMEQNARQKERKMIDKSIEDLKDEHAKQLRLIRAEAQAMTESVRSEMTNEIFLKEMMIQKASLKLKCATPTTERLVKRATQLEHERSNLPSLGCQSVKVVRKKARNNWRRAKNFFRRDRIA